MTPEFPIHIKDLSHKVPDFLFVDQLHPETLLEGEATLYGDVKALRKHPSDVFIDLGGPGTNMRLQIVVDVSRDDWRAFFGSLNIRPGTIIEVTGKITPRNQTNIREEDIANNPLSLYELMVSDPHSIRVLFQPEIRSTGLRWSTVRENPHLLTPELYGEIIRLPEFQRIMELRRGIEDVFADHFRERGFTQIDVPILSSAAAEGGAEVFRVKGRSEEKLTLIQSPQQIKQLLAAIKGRVFCITPAFRDDPSFTPYHLAEFTSLDMEMVTQFKDKDTAMESVMIEL